MPVADWMPLVVAGVGVAGTLAGATFGQVWSKRRDDQRWRLEREAESERRAYDREAEAERWRLEREAETARQKWERERDDRQHWLGERRQVYAEYLSAIKELHYSLGSALTDLVVTGTESEREESDRIATLQETLMLMAPPSIIRCVGTLDLLHRNAAMVISPGIDRSFFRGAEAPEDREERIMAKQGEARKLRKEWGSALFALRTAMRVDLGVESP